MVYDNNDETRIIERLIVIHRPVSRFSLDNLLGYKHIVNLGGLYKLKCKSSEDAIEAALGDLVDIIILDNSKNQVYISPRISELGASNETRIDEKILNIRTDGMSEEEKERYISENYFKENETGEFVSFNEAQEYTMKHPEEHALLNQELFGGRRSKE